MTFVLEAKKGKNLIEELKKKSLTIFEERSENSEITNEQELYNAVCREATIYEENADMRRMAENLLDEIEQRLCVGTFKEKIDYESYFQVLQIFYENWEDINWKDTAEFELKEKVKSFLSIYKTTKAFQIEDAVDVLSAVINAADGIYPIILVNALETCKNEKSYYDLLVFVQNNWNYISWDFEEDERIRFFTGEYEFLSNAYEEGFIHDGITYQNAEAAYQATKTEYEPLKRMFSTLNAHDAKKTGRQIVIRKNWHSETEMYNVLWDKFHQSPKLTSLLKNTKDAMIAPEGIGTFWGVKDGKGENHLGKILMEIRDTLPENDTKRDPSAYADDVIKMTPCTS